jgi:COMPASS component SWD3
MANFGPSRIWDTATGQCLKTIIHEDHAPVVGVRFSPNGRYILAWTLDSALRLWDYISGRCVKTYQGHTNSKFSIGGAFGTYGTPGYSYALIASGSEDGSIWIWDVSSKTVLQRIEKAHDDVVFDVDVLPADGLLVSGGGDKLIHVWKCDEHSAVNGSNQMDVDTPIKKEE